MRLTHLFLIAPAIFACKKVEPAPKELDALLHWFFVEHDTAEDETAAEAFRNLDEAVNGGNLDDVTDGSITALTADEAAGHSPSGTNAADGSGIYMVNAIDCTLDQITELVAAKNQRELYETYDVYDRTWLGDVPGFVDGDELDAEWDESFTVTVLGRTYDADTVGTARRIPNLEDDQSPWGATLMTRRVMHKVATFENDGDYYDQDNRSEVYYERSNGTVVHVAARWSEASFAGIESSNEGSQRLVLNGMKDWDDVSAELCESMR